MKNDDMNLMRDSSSKYKENSYKKDIYLAKLA